MDQKSEPTANIMAAIDACRHDSGDRDLPEVASVLAGVPTERVADYGRLIERIDRAVVGAMQAVPVPNGLAERILAGVQAHASRDEELFVRPTESDGNLERPRLDQPNLDQASVDDFVAGKGSKAAGRRSSRRLVVAGAAFAIAASLLGMLVWQRTRERLEPGDLMARVKEFYRTDDHAAELNDPSSIELPVGPVVGWRQVTLLSRSGAAFELAGRRGVKGTLYVVPLKSLWGPVFSGLPTSPLPQGTSRMTVAVWTNGTDVYVMIVEGDQRAFESFFVQKFA